MSEITWSGTENLPVPERPLLGLATTKELLAELEARLEREYDDGDRSDTYARHLLYDMIALCERGQHGLPDDILNYRTVDSQ